ncbi:hypothetical protein C8J57DRAFT_1422952 [Mycena rebaudengoi]|nr:hypothetical protein C8J57DRAFT_1422952 [Mycena rebaudengoi]
MREEHVREGTRRQEEWAARQRQEARRAREQQQRQSEYDQQYQRRDWERAWEQQREQEQGREWARQRQQQREREQQQQREREAERERLRRERAQAQHAERETQNRADYLTHHLGRCAAFDAMVFSPNEPNSFAHIPWPVFARPDGTIHVEDITAQNVRDFYNPSRWVRRTAGEIDVILKNAARGFHSDRFNVRRPVVSTIVDARERALVFEAAEVVIKTVK